ncbi:hypothetical protein [Shouchella miscanthi]|uniref:hypothetical protein n=1 Tax=Shouchella miscanthi TaxID=2598861 RepID=UPI0011A23727|nr:hypothetical protein [Shouchella miscanthi]
MQNTQCLSHIQRITPLAKKIEDILEQQKDLEAKQQQLERGPLRSLYHVKDLNSLFAVSILVYLFVFHTVFSASLITIYQLFSRIDILFISVISLFVLFVFMPILAYFLLIWSINKLFKRWLYYDHKENEVLLALKEAKEVEYELKHTLTDQTTIPMYYLKTYALAKFETYFLHQRADSMKEAINLFELEQQHVLQQYRFYQYNGERRFSKMYEKAAEFEKQVSS